jgi:hypothetical protein
MAADLAASHLIDLMLLMAPQVSPESTRKIFISVVYEVTHRLITTLIPTGENNFVGIRPETTVAQLGRQETAKKKPLTM